jgi:hypothetical protein
MTAHSSRTATRWCAVAALMIGVAAAPAAYAAGPEKMDPNARRTRYDSGLFKPDPNYDRLRYNRAQQLQVYGNKTAVPTPRPMVELGREIYRSGPFDTDSTIFGKLNPVVGSLYVYGDWRTAVAFNDNGDNELAQIATRLNLDVDFRITATERIHAFFAPLDNDNKFTRCEIGGNDKQGFDSTDCKLQLDAIPDALFFEGDLGAIYAGIRGRYPDYDIPITFGKIPILLQNGVWLEDNFIGAGISFPALNSRTFDISNMDFTFLYGFKDITTPAIQGDDSESDTRFYALTSFIEAMTGYWEIGYGYVQGIGDLSDQSYNNVTAAFSRRYGGWLTNTVRVIGNFGQEFRDANGQHTANGVAVLLENSLITSRPSTLIPYLNLFVGLDHPQSLARAANAGGILKNTGINFETDGLTGFPKLDDTANNTYGGALGVSYLFNLNQQIVFEFATVQTIGADNSVKRNAAGPEYALGVRYQLPLTEAWILRADAMYGLRTADDNIGGARVEFRRKF